MYPLCHRAAPGQAGAGPGWKAQIACVLKDRDALIRHVKEDDYRAENRSIPDYIDVQDMADRHKCKDKDLPAKTAET